MLRNVTKGCIKPMIVFLAPSALNKVTFRQPSPPTHDFCHLNDQITFIDKIIDKHNVFPLKKGMVPTPLYHRLKPAKSWSWGHHETNAVRVLCVRHQNHNERATVNYIKNLHIWSIKVLWGCWRSGNGVAQPRIRATGSKPTTCPDHTASPTLTLC